MLAPGSKVSRRLIRESQARRLIGGNVPLLAPGCEGTRTNPDPGDTETGLLKLLFSKFGTLQPSVVSRRQLVGVAEQFQQSRIIATGIPRQRNDGRRCPQFILPRHLNQDLMSWLFHQGWVNGRKLSRVKNGAGKGEVWTPLPYLWKADTESPNANQATNSRATWAGAQRAPTYRGSECRCVACLDPT